MNAQVQTNLLVSEAAAKVCNAAYAAITDLTAVAAEAELA